MFLDSTVALADSSYGEVKEFVLRDSGAGKRVVAVLSEGQETTLANTAQFIVCQMESYKAYYCRIMAYTSISVLTAIIRLVRTTTLGLKTLRLKQRSPLFRTLRTQWRR